MVIQAVITSRFPCFGMGQLCGAALELRIRLHSRNAGVTNSTGVLWIITWDGYGGQSEGNTRR